MMTQRKFLYASVVGAALLLVVAGCATKRCPNPARASTIHGESFVLAKQTPTRLAYLPSHNKPLALRSTYLDGRSNTVHFVAGQDFVVDYADGSIRRTAQSRIPDFSTNILFGIRDFDHSKFPGYGNHAFFVFADYTPKAAAAWPRQSPQLEFLKESQRKLAAGEKLRIVAFGDSITAGGEATQPHLIFWQRWADELQRRYPKANVEAINGATGGDRTSDGLNRLDQKVLKQNPDIVLIGFGMNDNNVPAFGVPLDQFSANLKTIIDRIRAQTKAEIVLYSAFPPNPNWLHGSKNMSSYAVATEAVAREKQCAFADVYNNWQALAAFKKPEDLLGNNINHPNDFGHWIYFQVLNRLGL